MTTNPFASFSYVSPMQVRFPWPNSDSTLQRNAIAGSVVRTVPHSSGSGGVSPAGVTASSYAVQES
jgi:hypothetical protein